MTIDGYVENQDFNNYNFGSSLAALEMSQHDVI